MRVTRWQRHAAPLSADDECAREEPLAIEVDGRTITITMRTPGHDAELAAGFLRAEGIIQRREDIAAIEQPSENRIQLMLAAGVTVDFDKLARHVFGSASCGLCGKTAIDRVRLPFEPIGKAGGIRAETLLSLPEKLRARQDAFTRTGGLHAAAAFTFEGDLVAAREDVGRHNAVDKISGWGLLEDRLPFSRHVLLVSGRTSFEILQKAVAAGFPVVAAVSAPSDLAVAFAREAGQTLIGFLRGDRLNVYAGESRIAF